MKVVPHGQMNVAGVVGRPISHSLSPRLHNIWIRAAGLNAVYMALEPQEANFSALLNGLRGSGISGLNVTSPFKTEALRLADRRTDRAARCGAANLLVFSADGRISADNTDGDGLAYALKNQAPNLQIHQTDVLILGAGGAARGAAVALSDLGAGRVWIHNRSRQRAEKLVADLRPHFGERLCIFDPSDQSKGTAALSLMINATPSGLEASACLGDRLGHLPQLCAVMDMVYRPVETPLLRLAKSTGRPTVDGLDMLIGQARPSFVAFFGCDAIEDDVRSELLAA